VSIVWAGVAFWCGLGYCRSVGCRKDTSGRYLLVPPQEPFEDVVERLIAVLEPDDVVIGGGNVKKLKKLPLGCRTGDNNNAFLGGFRLWEEPREAARAGGNPEGNAD
jgi:hypothetical protein